MKIKSGNYLIKSANDVLDIGEVWVDDDERDRFDALLIAAAPDLLEACKVAHGVLTGEPRNSMNVYEIGQLLQAAIAKAEGK